MKTFLLATIFSLIMSPVAFAQDSQPEGIKLPKLEIDVGEVLRPNLFLDFFKTDEIEKKSSDREISLKNPDFNFNLIETIKSFFNLVVSILKTGIGLVGKLIK